jgi:hypothetical protein
MTFPGMSLPEVIMMAHSLEPGLPPDVGSRSRSRSDVLDTAVRPSMRGSNPK